jgi:hypothetical protein
MHLCIKVSTRTQYQKYKSQNMTPKFQCYNLARRLGSKIRETLLKGVKECLMRQSSGGGNALQEFGRPRGRPHVRICIRIGELFGVRFGAKGGLKSNLGSIFSEMSLQTVVMCAR